MAIRSRLYSLAAVVVFAIAIAACSSDDNPAGGGTTDTTPPTVSNVAAVDESHIDVTFSEAVSKTSAEDTGHYIISAVLFPAAPGAASAGGQSVVAASLRTDKKTVTLTTGVPMGAVNYTLSVNGVADTHGNSITTTVDKPFTGSSDPDATAPEIVSRSPASNAPGVSIGAAVVIQFSEPVDYGSFIGGVSWTTGGGSISVIYTVLTEDNLTFTLTPDQALAYGTVYTVALSGVKDPSDNTVLDTNWQFTTTNVVDHTPPTLVSTIPANGATNVNVSSNLSLTFSEAVYQNAFNVMLSPDVGPGVETWSNGGKTVTFDPDTLLLDNQQYAFTIYPDGVRDLAGNGIDGVPTVLFTTGSALAIGSIAGTISGDPNSNVAGDPTGATVVANETVYNYTYGSTAVAGNNTYTIAHLPDGVYYLFAVMNTNGIDDLNPETGDAIGGYGFNVGAGDFDPDSVAVVGGNHKTGINFRLYDPSAIAGMVSYEGAFSAEPHALFVGLFETVGFDLTTSSPVVALEFFWPDDHNFLFNSFFDGFDDNAYYLVAILDANDNLEYDPAIDPVGVYGGTSPDPIQVQGGNDIFGLVLVLEDPIGMKPSASISWRVETAPNPALRRMRDMVRASVAAATK